MTVNSASLQTLSQDAREMITAGFRAGQSEYQIQRLLSRELGEKVPRKVIVGFKEKIEDNGPRSKHTKLLFKRTGAEIVRDFLEKVKEGEDVSHLQAVLEHAVYVDSLRRYAIQDEGLESLDIKDVIKITNDYGKLRLSSIRAGLSDGKDEKLSATLAVKLVELVESELSPDKNLSKVFQERKPGLIEKLKTLVAQDEVEEIELMQRLYEKRRMEQSGGNNV